MKIDLSNMDRTLAIVVFENEIYEDINHQYALEQIFSTEFVTNDNIDYLSEVTFHLSKKGDISTYDIYDDKYLISHFENNINRDIDIIKEYAKKNNLTIGTFINYESDIVKLF